MAGYSLDFLSCVGKPPRIIETSIEKNNLEGKRIYLFAASGSSSIDGSQNELKKLYPDLDIKAGKRFAQSSSDSTISEWLKSL